jgi:hypothetical protein
MIEKIQSTFIWAPGYLYGSLKRLVDEKPKLKHIYFCICDHFEPYWKNADKSTARKRIQAWVEGYSKVSDRFRDSDGNLLKYSFFYPQEEYRKEDLDILSEFCKAGFGETEIHLHHDNDTSENLRRTLIDYRKRLHETHGLLSVDRVTGNVVYGFIHGNWALDNSRPDGRWCGVNNEIEVLQETGCYADFTMPSAPNITQTKKINSIYYAKGSQNKRKSHNSGIDAAVDQKGEGLLMIQGPLGLNWENKKFFLLPRIENGGLIANNPITKQRIKNWIAHGVHVKGAPEHVFVKVYTHGAQEGNIEMFFSKRGMAQLFEYLQQYTTEIGLELHFVSARECTNIILALIKGQIGSIETMRNQCYVNW